MTHRNSSRHASEALAARDKPPRQSPQPPQNPPQNVEAAPGVMSRRFEFRRKLMETRGLSKLGVQVGSDADPPTLDKSLEPAVAVHGVNRLLVLPIGDDGQSIQAVDVGAIDEIAGAGVARVLSDKPVFAAMFTGVRHG